MESSPVLRQMLVAVSTQLAALSVGGVVAYPGALLHQFRANDSSIHLDLDTGSWIGSIHGLAGIPSVLMPFIMQWQGRKFAFTATCIIIIIGWLVAYTATNVTAILISESFHGLGTNGILAVSLLSVSEMVSPKYRNVSMLSFSTIQALGMALVGILTRYLHWKTIGLIMCCPIALSLMLSIAWPESPSWLALKGRFDKSEIAFVSLRGNDDCSKKEFDKMIDSLKAKMDRRAKKEASFRSFFRKVMRRDFYMPSLHMFVLLNSMYWSGVMTVIIYSMDMIHRLTSDESAVHYGSIAINFIIFTCYTITSILTTKFNHRPILLASMFFTTICLIGISCVSYLQSTGVLPKDTLWSISFLIAYMISSCLGLNSIVFTVAAEIMPVKHRGLGGGLYLIYTCLLHTSSLKISPYLFLYMDVWGTFLVYATNAVICGVFVWKYVPETKGKTLQEIEDFYNYGSFIQSNHNDREKMVDS